ncbi:MAG: tetratricopeptide repeat protein [Pseudomonadales bacterium]
MKSKRRMILASAATALLLAQGVVEAEMKNPLGGLKMPKIQLPGGKGWNPFGRKGIPIEVLADAKFPEVAKLSKIAVPNFKGQLGTDFTASLRDELSSASINGEKVFTISGTITSAPRDSAQGVVALAKRAGLNAVYIGDTAVSGGQSVPKSSEYCDGGLMVFGKCKGGEKKSTVCWDVTGTFTVNVQVIRTSDGNTVYEERKSETKEANHCQSSSGPVPTPAELALQAKEELIAAIRADIMPRTMTHQVRLMSNTKQMSQADKETFLEGKNWAQDERLNRACGIWEELSESSADAGKNVSVIYNLGVCAEYQQDYQGALKFYRKADSLVSSRNRDRKLPAEGVERVRSAQSAAGR